MNEIPNPYKTPEASLIDTGSGAMPGIFRFIKDPNGLTKFVIILLWVNLAIESAALLSNGAQYSLLNSQFTDAEATQNDQRQQLINYSSIILFLVTAVFFGMWIYRANVNSRGFGARNMTITPGWSVGWYFIPFANLVKPYHAMKEIFQVSIRPDYWTTARPPGTLGWWWGLWIANSITGSILGRLPVGTIDELQAQTVFAMVVNVLGIALDIFAIKLIKTITLNQNHLVSANY